MHLDQGLRELEIAAAPTRLQQLEQRFGEKCVVVEIRRQVRAAILVGREQSPVAPQLVMNENPLRQLRRR